MPGDNSLGENKLRKLAISIQDGSSSGQKKCEADDTDRMSDVRWNKEENEVILKPVFFPAEGQFLKLRTANLKHIWLNR